MPKVTFKDKNGAVQGTVEVESGASLRYAALEHDVPLYCMWAGLSKYANCHGNGLCWTDRVRVSPPSAVNPRTILEQAMNNIGTFKRNRNPQTRLACQVQVFDDCEVTTRCRGKTNRK